MEIVIPKPGLNGMVVGESAICQIDETTGSLRYRGYLIEELAEQATFEEVAYLLLYEQLPSSIELQSWRAELEHVKQLTSLLRQFLQTIPSSAHLMDVLRTAVSFLGMTDPDNNNPSHEANIRKATSLIAKIPLLISWAIQARYDHSPRQPLSQCSFAENLLYLITGTMDSDKAKELEISLNLYAEHELNASTFAARVTASTLADLYGAVAVAIATLKGPLHGGANEAVAVMFQAIGEPEKAKAWIHSRLTGKELIMGFGHRVLKHEDPRTTIMKRRAEGLSHKLADTRLYEMAEIIEQTMKEEKGLHPNLDFYTAVVYLLLRIPLETFTPIFVASRITGWCAHIIEQQDHNRLIRPRASYIGPSSREFLPLHCR
jgi:2-methylcitrate synthase/citrate synthase II